jgi:glycosyltransferase involved in cell wall biosynthesis
MIAVSVITPSKNMLSYLKRCHASITDQGIDDYEHIVMDAESTDGTVEWLKSNPNIISRVGKDDGMYDAINKGFAIATGSILAYLNCDEQYLPGTLEYVIDYFKDHPQTDLIFGDALLIRPDGTLISYRKGYKPRWHFMLASHLYVLSCTMFMRRRIFDDGLRFDVSYKSIGDLEFVVHILQRGYRVRHLRRYLSVFTMTGQNLSADAISQIEMRQLLRKAPSWVRLFRMPINVARLLEKALSGAYSQRGPIQYSVHVNEFEKRRNFRISHSTYKWPMK